ncbi:uncharacterized protein LOC104444246 isoform X2 [Eucalyptus grandis]|uniref:uncharacterized protein LOC104444246 isoform X1 n=1 Tax=Eucalyptus grandis TaxID=71139 RepID=UPI00192E8381|nr:uncharacterized protein LOC104444246 isoform X1 [Eucalyptus grandis]XP_039155213.1 uncharacterized protein LOC104444246 isoform X2 [Eucalyptus grandis]
MSETAEFLAVVPGWDRDKLDLCMEVCLYIASLGDRATLVIPSYLSSAIPSSFPSNPLVAVAQIGSSSARRMSLILWFKFRWDLARYLEERRMAAGGELPRKLYAVVVTGEESIREMFRNFNVTVNPVPLALLEIVRRWKLPVGSDLSETFEFLVVVPGWDPDKLHLCMEVCLYIASRGDRATLVIPSYLSSAIPPSFPSNPRVAVAQIGSSSAHRMLLILWFKFRWDLAVYLEERRMAAGGELPRKLYAVVVPGAESTRDLFRNFNVTVDPSPLARVEFERMRKVRASDVRPGESRLPAGLPEEMAIVRSDLKMKPFGPPRGGPPGPDPRPGGGGGGPPSVPEVEGSIGRMTNKSADPEQPFFDNMGDRMKMVGGIRPLLPEQYWKTSGSVICGPEILSRPSTGGFLSHGGWNSTSPRRSPIATWPFLGKRYYNTDSPGDHLKVGHVASNDMPKSAMDDEFKGINVTVASEAFASFQFDLKLQRRIGRLRIGASISRLARSMR